MASEEEEELDCDVSLNPYFGFKTDSASAATSGSRYSQSLRQPTEPAVEPAAEGVMFKLVESQ